MAGNQSSYEKGNLYQIPLTQLIPDPEQPRKFFDEQALAELQASIVSHGVLQPILVRSGNDGTFYIVSGERRYQASKNAALETIPAILTDGEPAEIAIIENLVRENLTAIEEAEAIERLRAVHDYGLSELSTALGKSDTAISAILSLNRLPVEVKDDCRNDPKTARGILVEIAKLKTQEKMTALYTKYKESGLTRGEIRKQTAKPKPVDAPLDISFLPSWSEKLDQIDLPSSLKKALIDKDNLKAKQKDDIAIKKIDNDIQLEKKLFQLMSSIPDIISFATSRNLLSPAAYTALEKVSTGNINLGMTEKKALSVLFQRMTDIGYEFNV